MKHWRLPHSSRIKPRGEGTCRTVINVYLSIEEIVATRRHTLSCNSTMFWLAAVLLLLLLLTYQLVGQAQFAPNIITRQEGPSSCVDCRLQRTLFNIVWGCISTTIICAWAAIHPNIPPREGPFKRTLRRLELMFWTIMAPEMLPCWALNQLLAAMTVRDVYNKRKGMLWTYFDKSFHERGSDYEKKRCGIWETVEGWFSLYQIKEAASRGGLRSI